MTDSNPLRVAHALAEAHTASRPRILQGPTVAGGSEKGSSAAVTRDGGEMGHIPSRKASNGGTYHDGNPIKGMLIAAPVSAAMWLGVAWLAGLL